MLSRLSFSRNVLIAGAALSFVVGTVDAQSNKPNSRQPATIPVPNRQPAAPAKSPNPPAAPPTTPAAKTPTGPASGTIEFSDEALKIEGVGMSLNIPVGSVSRTTTVGDKRTIQILPKEGDQFQNEKAWLINITTPTTASAKTGIKESIEQIESLIKGSFGVTDKDQKVVISTQAKVLERVDELTIKGQKAGRLYMQVPAARDTEIVKGYTVFNPAPKQFVIIELVTPSEAFPRVKGTYELITATAKFEDSKAIDTERAEICRAGAAFLKGLTEPDYLAAMGENEMWQRLYRPVGTGAATDDVELGYRGLKFWRGKRGEINPETPRAQWTDADQQDGILARLSVRLLDDGNGALGDRTKQTAFIDSVGLYFMSRDRREEAWTVHLVRRAVGGKELARWTETGARLDQQVTVVVGDPREGTRPIVAPYSSDAYVCQLETFLLPKLLVKGAIRQNSKSIEAGFYSYRTETEAVSLRRDIAQSDSTRTGAWTVTTRIREDAPSQVNVFSKDGQHIRTELPDGRLWEPIEIDALFKMWQDKGLPTDTGGKTTGKAPKKAR